MYSGRLSPPKGWSASTWALLCPSRPAIKAVSVSAQSYFLVAMGFRVARHHGKVLTPRTQSIHMDSVRRAIPCRYSGKPHYSMLGCNITSDTWAANQAKNACCVQNPASVATRERILFNHLGGSILASKHDSNHVDINVLLKDGLVEAPDRLGILGFHGNTGVIDHS